MLKIFVALSLVLSSCAVTTPMTVVRTEKSYFGLADRQEMQRLNESTVKIEWVCGLKNQGGMGSGVVIGHKKDKTFVATAAHVSDYINNNNCDIIVFDSKGFSGFAKVLKSDEDTDVAVLEVGEPIGKTAGLYRDPYLGQPITCIGWPSLPHRDYRGKSITRGHVSTLTGDFIRVSADLYFGNSGGACFSEDSKVVGIVSHFMIGGSFFGETVPFPGQYFIAHVDNLKKLLD